VPRSDADALQLSVHPSRDADLLTPNSIKSDPPLAMRSYIDHFGDLITRVEAPAGRVAFSNRFVIHDSCEPDVTAPNTEMTPIADLPDDVLLFLVQAGIATATSSPISPCRISG
jgi:hypothetical protein